MQNFDSGNKSNHSYVAESACFSTSTFESIAHNGSELLCPALYYIL